MPRQLRPPLEPGPACSSVCLLAADFLDLVQPYLPYFPVRVGRRMEEENSGVPCDRCVTQHQPTVLLKALQQLLFHHETYIIRLSQASLESSLVTLSSLQSSLLADPQDSNPTRIPRSLHLLSSLLRRLCPQILARRVPLPPSTLS